MRRQLAQAVERFFDHIRLPAQRDPLTSGERRLADCTLAVRCRNAVERDSLGRHIELIPEPEAPTRLTAVLSQIMAGLTAIGVDTASRKRIIYKIAFDCAPKVRRLVFAEVAGKIVSR